MAKIESRFRKDANIEYGNSLVDIKFIHKKFDIVVANPPYGVDWKGYKKDIENDQTERFHALPSVSDGQFLFTQHILHHLDTTGLSVVVHNGSTLFSGDAGSGESNIRKYFFDNDWVEALIQTPTDEFFNTGIYTYLWVFNKNKAADRKDKVILINASEQFEQLKKSRGKKRKQMTSVNRTEIVQMLTDFKDTDNAKVFDKWHFYFNKQAIMLTNVDENGKTIADELKGKSKTLKPVKITVEDEENPIEITDFEITETPEGYKNLQEYYNDYYKNLISGLDYKEQNLKVFTKKETYWFDNDKETIVKVNSSESQTNHSSLTTNNYLGCGKIVIKAAYKKATKTKEASIQIKTELTPDYQKDYEIIPYSPDEDENQKNIADFMAKYITKPFEYLDNVIGVEINFNKVFYKPEKLREVTEIKADLELLEKELAELENELEL